VDWSNVLYKVGI